MEKAIIQKKNESCGELHHILSEYCKENNSKIEKRKTLGKVTNSHLFEKNLKRCCKHYNVLFTFICFSLTHQLARITPAGKMSYEFLPAMRVIWELNQLVCNIIVFFHSQLGAFQLVNHTPLLKFIVPTGRFLHND